MPNLGVTGLTTLFVATATFLLVLNVYSGWRWWVKAGAVVVLSVLYLVLYFTLPQLLGWPTDGPLPQHFRLLAVDLRDPSELTDTKGGIYIWVTDMDGAGTTEPRAYAVPYTVELRQKVAEAGQKLKQGIPQLAEIKEDDSGGPPGQETNALLLNQKSVKIDFYDLPEPVAPTK